MNLFSGKEFIQSVSLYFHLKQLFEMKSFIAVLAFMILAFVAEAQTPPTFKGNVTQIMSAGRIVDGIELQPEQLPYFKNQGQPFSIKLVPKSNENKTEVEIVRARYYQGDNTVDVPVSVNQWDSVALVYLANDNTALFANYRVFIGFGQYQNN